MIAQKTKIKGGEHYVRDAEEKLKKDFLYLPARSLTIGAPLKSFPGLFFIFSS